ncbi:hypothetical protein U1Q18_032709 [Sarracenia purpurea var. burkii]
MGSANRFGVLADFHPENDLIATHGKRSRVHAEERDLETNNDLKKEVGSGAPAETRTEVESGAPPSVVSTVGAVHVSAVGFLQSTEFIVKEEDKEDNASADSMVRGELGPSLRLESTIPVVSADLRKAKKLEDPEFGSEGEYEQGSEMADVELGPEVAVLCGVNNNKGKCESVSAKKGVASDATSSSSGEYEGEGKVEEEGADSEAVLDRQSGDSLPVTVNSVTPVRSGDVGTVDCVKPKSLNGDLKNQPVENKDGYGVAHNVLDELSQRTVPFQEQCSSVVNFFAPNFDSVPALPQVNVVEDLHPMLSVGVSSDPRSASLEGCKEQHVEENGLCGAHGRPPVGAHNVLNDRPQSNTEAHSTRTWAKVVGNIPKLPGTPRLNQRSASPAKMEYFAPDTPGDLEEETRPYGEGCSSEDEETGEKGESLSAQPSEGPESLNVGCKSWAKIVATGGKSDAQQSLAQMAKGGDPGPKPRPASNLEFIAPENPEWLTMYFGYSDVSALCELWVCRALLMLVVVIFG